MISLSKKYKGLHPGIVLNRELKKRNLKQRPFALSLGEHPQSFNSILNGKRNLPISLALKIEQELDLKEGDLALLQTYYEIEKIKLQNSETPNLNILRKSLFWDTNIDSIDWQKNSNAVIRRVFERGNGEEKLEIQRFYGQSKINKALVSNSTKPIQLNSN
ncbi:MAG TPA: helix-turn-helix domain-containing protein [Moheibacter sp.]|nr:helix-turn-helix domain-containing protein [Moheibacter sp.]